MFVFSLSWPIAGAADAEPLRLSFQKIPAQRQGRAPAGAPMTDHARKGK
jgi:hypothetical protein